MPIDLTDNDYHAFCRKVAQAWLDTTRSMPNRSLADRVIRRRAFHDACDKLLEEFEELREPQPTYQ